MVIKRLPNCRSVIDIQMKDQTLFQKEMIHVGNLQLIQINHINLIQEDLKSNN